MTGILVTGAYGQLGSEIKKLSGKYPYRFIFTDMDVLDITSMESLHQYCHGKDFQYIINCAAYTAVDKAESEPGKAFAVNRDAVTNLANLAREKDAVLIHISTDYVFDGSANIPYNEENTVNPLAVYGQSKEAGEKEALAYEKTIILRTSWLYSSFGNNIVKTILKLSAERDELRFVFDQAGTPTFAGDLAAAILSIIAHTENSGLKPGIYHYSNEGVCSWFDVAWEILHYTGSKCKVFPIGSGVYPSPVKRPAYSVLNKQKIKDTFALDVPYWKISLYKCIDILTQK